MTTKHFDDRFQERVGRLPIPSMKVIELYNHSQNVTKHSTEKSESVCIHIFEDEIVKEDGENELWVLIRNNKLVTTWRRNEDNRTFTSSDGMNVDKMSYQLIR
jgi:hypothetical protein